MIVQLGFVHAERQSVLVYGSRDVVIARDFDRVFSFDDFRASSSIFQRPAFFKGRDVSFIARDFACQRLQLRDIDRVIVVDTARDIDDTAIVGGDVLIPCFVRRLAYRYNTGRGFYLFVAEVCFSVYRFFRNGVAADRDTVFVIGTRAESQCYAAFFVHDGIGTESRCKFRAGVRPMTDRCRFFFKCTRLFAQCRAVIPFGNRRGTDRCRIGVMRFCACSQCRRLVSESARFHTDRHRVFACQFSRTRYCIISDRQIRFARVPCIPRIRHARPQMTLRFGADIGAITDSNATAARLIYRAVRSYCNSAIRQRFCFHTDADATLSSCFRIRAQCKCLQFRRTRLVTDRRSEMTIRLALST